VRCYININIVTSSLTSGLDVPRSTQNGILVFVSRSVDDKDDDDDDDDDDSNNNNNNNQ
jgi:hypothetical protein